MADSERTEDVPISLHVATYKALCKHILIWPMLRRIQKNQFYKFVGKKSYKATLQKIYFSSEGPG